ncbi:DUF2279 domain-containing protein [Flavisolibacter ginsengisoli]|uniref:Uncharacterized conserved protein YfiM, DUF2279 family n=1 Tax=Flavisolibacter ginsengisoli DSM 18119 TaxID=1121884 RepID=A0A1M5BKJ3_9BACT|nr:DUF2279 domain-containing protein [Flavisolibacter ginsengisoli]SHF42988.1 Uncharacterized conserved protein YfiM, DUF2279 family [Flavisolibacter ginsengisoli DSM 18119]
MRKWLVSVFIFIALSANAQEYNAHIHNRDSALLPASTINFSERKWMAATGMAAVYGGSFIFLNEAWYKGYPRTSFHSFNDAGEWLQMDKIGHAWTAYHSSRVNTTVWKWAGMNDRQSVVLGTGTSLAYMLSIEYLDGRSAEWGWSWPDAAADLFGATLFASQALVWKEQKISLKFSSFQKKYKPAALEQRANDLFGSSLPERLLKDYNAQTYWLSINLSSTCGIDGLPPWLNLAIGYGADNMFGGYQNLAYDKEGNVVFDRRDLKRRRQWYLSPDIDLARIKTKSRFLRTAFSVLNVLKIPAPTLELSNGKFKGHWISF